MAEALEGGHAVLERIDRRRDEHGVTRTRAADPDLRPSELPWRPAVPARMVHERTVHSVPKGKGRDRSL